MENYSNKLIRRYESILYTLIPIFLATIYLVKDLFWTVPIFVFGLLIHVGLYREYNKNGTGKYYLKNKLGAVVIGVLLILYIFIKN